MNCRLCLHRKLWWQPATIYNRNIQWSNVILNRDSGHAPSDCVIIQASFAFWQPVWSHVHVSACESFPLKLLALPTFINTEWPPTLHCKSKSAVQRVHPALEETTEFQSKVFYSWCLANLCVLVPFQLSVSLYCCFVAHLCFLFTLHPSVYSS